MKGLKGRCKARPGRARPVELSRINPNKSLKPRKFSMNARYLRALLGALALCMTAVGAVAAPQYAVIDLGSSTDPGAGLIWQKRVAQLAAQNWPPTQASCINGLSNWIYAWYGSVAVGTACEPDGTEHAAKWTIDVATQTITLTDLGAPPNPESNAPGSASVYGFNKVG